MERSRTSRFTIIEKPSVIDKPKQSVIDKPRQSVIEGPLAYEWESAKSKPHARIISRKPPKLAAAQTGEMENMFGLSRFGMSSSPKAIINGRRPDPLDPIPDNRPAAYSKQDVAGKYKPNPLILSRRKPIEVGSGSGVMQNIYGYTRFGKANPPRAVIIGRQVIKDKRAPGPGAYDSNGPVDTMVGIQIKGRLKAWGYDTPQPGANAYALPSFLKNDTGFSFAGRYVDDIHSRSPGPIYNIRTLPQRKKGISLTFKPFPVKLQKELPGPNEYSCLPGNQKIETTMLRAPVVRFAGKPYNNNEDEDGYYQPEATGAGPADFNLSSYHGTSQDKPHAIITSRPASNFTSCGSGKLENLFGKTRFGRPNPPKGIIVSRHPKKDKSLPGPGAYDPQVTTDTRVGIKMKARWPNAKQARRGSTGPGPGDYNLPSMGTGPAFSMVPKFRGEIGVLEKVPKLNDDTDCKKRIEEKQLEKEKPKGRCSPCPFQSAPELPDWRVGFEDLDNAYLRLDRFLC